ncbi:MAG: hypothetical protein ACTSPY_16535 [Candidatus Helarchaeota archaeon]
MNKKLKNKLINILTIEFLIWFFGFLLNFCWEISQIPFYQGWNRGAYWFGENTLEMRIHFVYVFWEASIGDGLIILGIHLFITLICWNRKWFIKGGHFPINKKIKLRS